MQKDQANRLNAYFSSIPPYKAKKAKKEDSDSDQVEDEDSNYEMPQTNKPNDSRDKSGN